MVMNDFDDSLEGSISKPITISPEDLQELESVQGYSGEYIVDDPVALKVYNVIKKRRVTTRKILEVKFNITNRTARTITDKLIRGRLIEKNYAYIRGENGAKVKTAIFTDTKNE